MNESTDPQHQQQPTAKKVFVETWGCQMNVADSEEMLQTLNSLGYEQTRDENDANFFLLNTCHIREKARHKVVSRLGRLREFKNKNPDIKIAVTGCVAQAEGKKLLKQAPYIDLVMGPGRIRDLSSLLTQGEDQDTSKLALGFPEKEYRSPFANNKIKPAPVMPGKNEVSRFVNIQQGCNNYCTFCVVPHTRGREISKPIDDIVAECAQFSSQGAKEVTLLGQNVNSYGLDLKQYSSLASPFATLLDRVATMSGLERVRFTTSNPHDFDKEIAECFTKHESLGKYLHLPVQSGSNRTLERMKRKVTREEFLKKVTMLRQTNPEFALSTDLIVGFPGETDEEFEETVSLLREVQFSFVFSFKYSPRSGTPAARFPGQIDEAVKSSRLAKLNQVQDEITISLNQREIGKTRNVLFAYESKKEPGIYYGRTDEFRLARVKSSRDIAGRVLPVMIEAASKTALTGILV